MVSTISAEKLLSQHHMPSFIAANSQSLPAPGLPIFYPQQQISSVAVCPVADNIQKPTHSQPLPQNMQLPLFPPRQYMSSIIVKPPTTNSGDATQPQPTVLLAGDGLVQSPTSAVGNK